MLPAPRRDYLPLAPAGTCAPGAHSTLVSCCHRQDSRLCSSAEPRTSDPGIANLRMTSKDLAITCLARLLRTRLCSLLLRAVCRTPVFVITTNPGAFLGNQLTIFSHVIACARDTGRDIWGASLFPYAKYFESTSRDLLARFPARRSLFPSQALRVFLYYYVFARFVRVLLLRPDPPLKDLGVITDYEGRQSLESKHFLDQVARKRLVLIEGYFFRTSVARITAHSPAIKAFFRPLKHHEANAEAVVRAARINGDVLVGVHLRQFDSVIDHTPHHLYKYQHVEHMSQAMRHTVGLLSGKRVVFLLSSNRKIDHSRFAGFSTAEGTGHMVEDLHALSLCDYILASTYSTYSRWASFYGNVPLYQMDTPGSPFSLQDFRVQVPGYYDPSDESSPIHV